MPTFLIRLVIALFLIAHELVHFILTVVPVAAPGAARTPFWPAFLYS